MNRIAMLRKEKGLSQISLSLKLNVSQKMISAHGNGKSEPSIATLMQMADIFNTSVDYIIGYTNIRQPIDKTVQMSLNEDECDLLSGYRELSAKQQNIALGVILGLLNSEKN
ncbi:helix-turn-helix transcriptional regulator [uncultured Ruminococcus sp.]|uniref:helix-turn-helix transcriptional regulator n=1 Tax=uncultured Ruminococcus sp. TaxID=165186 RepID=UPI00265CBAD4|nr:helix-turn-helix transcriptional regulator [uncultured Ruminococcus sp.]